MKSKNHKIILTCLLALCGCANPFNRFYTNQIQGISPEILSAKLEPSSQDPKILSGSTAEVDSKKMAERGYAQIGYSAFTSDVVVTQKQLVSQALNVGADIVVFYSKFSHTESGIQPVTSFQPGTTSVTNYNGSSTATAYGSGGYANAYGSQSGTATTQTLGTFSTSYVPYQKSIYEYGATFWRKIKPPTLGINALPLPDAVRAKLQRNTGAYVSVVVDGSPAFNANILEGDVLTKIDTTDINSPDDLQKVLPFYIGKKATLEIIRDGNEKSIEVQMN